MVKYCVLFIAFLNFLLVQAQNDGGNIIPKPGSALPQEPKSLGSKSLTSNCGCSRVLTFDDITTVANTAMGTIPNGYGGLNWGNATYLNTTWERVSYGWNGYAVGRTSGIFVGLNSFGGRLSMSVPVGQYFQLNSLSLAAAWNNNLMVTIKATQANTLLYQTVVSLQVATKTNLYMLKWSGIDKITFDATNGTLYPGLSGSGTEFAFDDVDISI